MHCPSCGVIASDSAKLCPSCGRSLEEPPQETVPIERPAPGAYQAPGPEHRAGRALAAFGARWADAVVAAGLCFLALLVVGGVLLIALKLRFPLLGTGADPLQAAGGLVIVSLAVLGAPVSIGGVSLWSLPMGAVAIAGLAMVYAGADLAGRSDAGTPRQRIVAGARLGAPLALICLAASLAFRLKLGHEEIGASVVASTLLGGLWGALFGAVGAASRAAPLRTYAAAASKSLALRSLRAGRIASALGSSLLGASVPAAMMGLLLVVGRIAQAFFGGRPGGGAAAGLVLLAVAFAPNIVVSLACAGLGAPLHVGAGVSVGGRLVGPSTDLSLLGWVGRPLPGWAIVFVTVPLLAGWMAARRLDRDRVGLQATLGLGATLGSAALTGVAFGIVMMAAALLARAHIGIRLVHSAGFASIGPGVWETLVLGAIWVALVSGSVVALLERSRGTM